MKEGQIWKDQLLCFCPSQEILQRAASGADGIKNDVRRAVAKNLCDDIEQWGWVQSIDELVGNTRNLLSPYARKLEWLPESRMPMQEIIHYFQRQDLDVRKEQHLFEVDGFIAEADLQAAAMLPFEIGVARMNKQLVAWSGIQTDTGNYAYSKQDNPILHWIDLNSEVFLHSHPKNSQSRGDSPSWADLRAADDHGHLLIAHAEGILKFRGATLEQAQEWMQREGVLAEGEFTLSGPEFTNELRRCCLEMGIIEKEGAWGAGDCGELMALLNGQTMK